MGKRSDFERVSRDLYETPWTAVLPLTPFVSDVTGYCEPCAGDGALINHLRYLGLACVLARDLEPCQGIDKGDALDLTDQDLHGASHIITNPPWPAAGNSNGEPTMTLIRHLSALRPTWLLLSADFMHNLYAAEALSTCPMIVSVGRVKWMPGTKHVGLENAAWYLFDRRLTLPVPTVFVPRAPISELSKAAVARWKAAA